MLTGWHPAYVLVASGVVTAALGVLVLLRNPARGLNRSFFALTVLAGASNVLVGLVFADPVGPLALTWVRSFWYFEPWVSALLVVVALHIPAPSGALLRRPFLTHAAILAPAAAAAALYALFPEAFLTLSAVDGQPYYALTALGIGLLVARGLAAGLAVVILASRFRRTPHALQRTQIAWATAAILVGYLPFLGLDLVNQVLSNSASLAVWGFAAGAVVAHAGALVALRPWNASLFRDDDRQIVAVSYVSGTALTIALALLATVPAVDVVYGLLALAHPLILAYAILKFDLFGLDLRLKKAAPHATLALFLAAIFTFCLNAAAKLSPAADASRLFVVAGVLTAASALPIHRATTRLATRLGWNVVSDGAVAERRLEIYRAAVENSFTRGEDIDASATLQDLRQRLELNTRDHRLMVQAVLDAANALPAVPTGPLREGDFVMRKYRVVKFLGSGSFGRALLAEHVGMGRQVVIKEPHESYRSRTALQQLSKEARLAARVQHPNVVTLYDFEEHHDTGYLVFEYVPSGSIEERLKSGALPREEAYRIFEGILRGLDAIHDARIVHMDLKPSNILLGAEGEPKITDFGIANELRVEATLARSIGGQAHPGTLLYMAPEQVRGRRDPGPRADLYAAGVVFHEMLTGERYLDFPDSPILIQEAILYKEPRLDNPLLKPSEQDLLAALLAKAPADRPASAREVLARFGADVAQNFKRGDADSRERRALREA